MTHNSYDFAGKTVLVTGGGTGIGLATVRAFLDNGANVVLTGRRKEKLEEAVDGVDPARVLTVSTDIGDRAQIDDLVRHITSTFGGLDVVVANASGFAPGPITDVSAEDWETVRRTNVDGFFHLVQATLPLLEASQGNLVLVSSVSAQAGDWGQSAYNATKHAQLGLLRSVALDYGPKGVRLNAVAPAFTITDLTADMAADSDVVDSFVDRVTLGRPGQPEDIAPAVLFLASADAAYVTGTVLNVDGGTMASTGQPHL
ncbi:SDR family NAD(P)-dependent oxidoreductase [Nocardioides bruguierae]|uniref:SDR family NAD(P)-dependent oxidoreductase n=1 Tax=Nocardioides bruguierae TaxID=2945102 RepID=UPI002021CA0B|nr:SDR family NAD(P)-dependent oxidoreductase [Nocardioides bruguierae]MCL8024373.1 SDR family oxidoreductase [Nocardioides bruguierae]